MGNRIVNLGMPHFAYLQVIPLLFHFEDLQSKLRANPVWEGMGGEGNPDQHLQREVKNTKMAAECWICDTALLLGTPEAGTFLMLITGVSFTERCR